MVPVVFVSKKSGKVGFRVDHCKLRKTEKDAYPLSLYYRRTKIDILAPDSLSALFGPPTDQLKMVFHICPGVGLYEFKRIPFGLVGEQSHFNSQLRRSSGGSLLKQSTWMIYTAPLS